MKKIHETDSSKRRNDDQDQRIYSPIENLQNIEGGGPLNKKGLENISGLPLGIKVTGFVLFGLLGISIIFVVLFSFYQNYIQ